MQGGAHRDELTILFERVRRFLASWLILLIALAAAPIAFAALAEVVALMMLGPRWAEGRLYAHPLAQSAFWALGSVCAGIVIGGPVVLLRRHIIRPEAPFLRVGYLGVAAIPFLLAISVGDTGPGWYVLPAYMQLVLVLAALIYVGLARRFRLFDPEEWRGAHAQ